MRASGAGVGNTRYIERFDYVRGIAVLVWFETQRDDTRELGKQPAEIFHRGTLGEGMRSALEHIKATYEEMIDGWRRG